MDHYGRERFETEKNAHRVPILSDLVCWVRGTQIPPPLHRQNTPTPTSGTTTPVATPPVTPGASPQTTPQMKAHSMHHVGHRPVAFKL